MSLFLHTGFAAGLVGVAVFVACAAQAMGHPGQSVVGCGTRENPIEVLLPPELQAQLFHSLPIAGLLSTPDSVAQRVLQDPRLRATTAPSLTGMGRAHPVSQPGVVCTRADLFD